MIDINLIRKTPEYVKNACLRRGETIPIEEILEIDKIKRDSLSKASELRAHRNKVSRDIGLSKKASPEIIDQMKQIGQDIKKLDIATCVLYYITEWIYIVIGNSTTPFTTK